MEQRVASNDYVIGAAFLSVFNEYFFNPQLLDHLMQGSRFA